MIQPDDKLTIDLGFCFLGWIRFGLLVTLEEQIKCRGLSRAFIRLDGQRQLLRLAIAVLHCHTRIYANIGDNITWTLFGRNLVYRWSMNLGFLNIIRLIPFPINYCDEGTWPGGVDLDFTRLLQSGDNSPIPAFLNTEFTAYGGTGYYELSSLDIDASPCLILQVRITEAIKEETGHIMLLEPFPIND